MYGPDSKTEICLTVGNRINIQEGLVKSCWQDTCREIEIDAYCDIYVPNALYPSDPSSDAHEFLPKGKSLVDYHLQIFDRFGNLLWETTELRINDDGSPAVGWKGETLDGDIVPQGTYIWQIRGTCSNGKIWNGTRDNGKTTGLVYLIR